MNTIKIIITVGGGFAFLSIGYLFLCLSIALSFFMLGGPTEVIFIIDLNPDSPDVVIISLLMISFFIGLSGLIIGLILSFLRTHTKLETKTDLTNFPTNATEPDFNIDIQLFKSESNDLNLIENGLKPKKK